MFEHKVKTSMFTTIQCYIRNSTQGNKARIRKKGLRNGEEEIKLYLYTENMMVNGKFQEIYKRLSRNNK